MASLTTYLLISDPADMDAVKGHSIIEEEEFELQKTWAKGEGQAPALRFSVTRPLEAEGDFERPCQALSEAFPAATVVLCEVEERFNQIDHLRTVVYTDGSRAGDFEQGYILNVGS